MPDENYNLFEPIPDSGTRSSTSWKDIKIRNLEKTCEKLENEVLQLRKQARENTYDQYLKPMNELKEMMEELLKRKDDKKMNDGVLRGADREAYDANVHKEFEEMNTSNSDAMEKSSDQDILDEIKCLKRTMKYLKKRLKYLEKKVERK